jgi:hypothetical protein
MLGYAVLVLHKQEGNGMKLFYRVLYAAVIASWFCPLSMLAQQPCASLSITRASCTSCKPGNRCKPTYIPQNRFLSHRPEYLPKPFIKNGLQGDMFALYKYQQSFDDESLASCLLGKQKLVFQGSTYPNRSADAFLADQIGLPSNFSGSLQVTPSIHNKLIDIGWFLRSNRFPQWHIELYTPVQITTWHLLAHENDDVPLSALEKSYPPGYFDITSTPVPHTTIKDALKGELPWGLNIFPWSFGRWRFEPQTAAALANLEGRLAYDLIISDTGHLGAYALVQAPTGNGVYGHYFFAPVCGNGKHWKMGGGVTAHYDLLRSDSYELLLYFEANAGHLFMHEQLRSFDFTTKDCCLSRLLLLKVLDNSATSLIEESQGNLFSTRYANVTIACEGEAKLEVAYKQNGFKLAAGYNLYGRSKEEIVIQPDITCGFLNYLPPNEQVGFAGCSGVVAYMYPTALENGIEVITSTASYPYLLTSTQNSVSCSQCGMVDNPQQLYQPATQEQPGLIGINYTYNLNGETADTIPAGTPVTQVVPYAAYTSNPPTTFASDDVTQLDAAGGGMPALLSHTLFATLTYTFEKHSHTPMLMIGGEGEFRQKGFCCTLSQWGLWCGGGCSF